MTATGQKRSIVFITKYLRICRVLFLEEESSMRHLITWGFVAGAFTAYYFGFEVGSGALFLVGAFFEIVSIKRLRRSSHGLH